MTDSQTSQRPVPQLDHVVINVAEQLNGAEQQFRRLGFQLTPRGHHSLGSSNHLAIFGENYLELLGFEPGNAHTRKDLWQAPLGLTGLVWKTQNSNAVFDHLQQQNIAGSAPAEFFRPVALNDGTSPNARFRTVPLAADRVPNGRSFFCQHLTPELVWRTEWQNHPNGVADITGFVISAASPQAAAKVYGELFGTEALQTSAEGVTLRAGRATVRFVTPQQAQAEFGTVPEGENGSARMVGLEFATRSLDAVRNSLRVGEISFNDLTSRVLVRAADSLGVAVSFSEE
ncbi:VOC family protein [Rahnella sp. Lac-M11]|uniref:VOC family protein n=1 Tax=Rahnella contaminans TaxID=2703882 RepID=A0A6M2B7J0_9GAMM|nr:VOC family protein [Rahnella contaminans]NGX88187.1 VOC family protein [Rahnella contaminans]